MHVQHDFHIRWCSCHLKITRLLPLVKQELFTFPEHVSPFRFSFGSCWLIFSFTWSVLWTIVSLSSVLLLIILSVLWLAAHHIVRPMIGRFWLYIWCPQTFLIYFESMMPNTCLYKAEHCYKKYRPCVQVSMHGVGSGPASGGYEWTEKWGGDMFSDWYEKW
jgi:hypothetical protein